MEVNAGAVTKPYVESSQSPADFIPVRISDGSQFTTLPISGTIGITGGTVAISNFPTIQQISGTVGVSGVELIAGTVAINVGTVSISNFPVTQQISGTVGIGSGSVGIVGTVPVSGTFFQATQPISGTVSVSNFPASQAVTGTFFQNTQPVSGAVSVSNLPSIQAVSGTVSITNSTLAVTQSTSPWVVSGTTNTTIPIAIKNGTKLVVVTGTGTTIVTNSSTVSGVIIQALAANGGIVYVGNSGLASSTATGYELQPGQATSSAIDDLIKVYVNGNSGDGICYISS